MDHWAPEDSGERPGTCAGSVGSRAGVARPGLQHVPCPVLHHRRLARDRTSANTAEPSGEAGELNLSQLLTWGFILLKTEIRTGLLRHGK